MLPQSRESRHRFKGRLEGAGKEATCDGWCTEVSFSDGKTVFQDYQLWEESVTPRLPDGAYELSVHGNRRPATRLNGRWLVS